MELVLSLPLDSCSVHHSFIIQLGTQLTRPVVSSAAGARGKLEVRWSPAFTIFRSKLGIKDDDKVVTETV